MGAIDLRLAELGLDLPKAPPPAANYVPALRSGNLIFIAGQVCFGTDGKLSDRHKGKLGAEVSDEMGREAARLCGVNVLAQLRAAVGEPSLWYLNWGQEPGQINRHLGRRNRAGTQCHPESNVVDSMLSTGHLI